MSKKQLCTISSRCTHTHAQAIVVRNDSRVNLTKKVDASQNFLYTYTLNLCCVAFANTSHTTEIGTQ